jgi:outer membrane protein TolC
MRIIFFTILLCWSINLFAQQNLSLEELWQVLKDNNYTLQQQQKLIDIAAEDVSFQSASQYPILSMGAVFHHQSEVASLELPFTLPNGSRPNINAGVKDQYDLSLAVSQPIFTGFRTSSLIQSANQQLYSTELQKNVVANELMLAVGNLYFQSQLNLVQRKVLQQSEKRIENQLTLIRNLMEAEQKTAFDTLEVANRKLTIQSQLIRLKDGYEILLSKIRYLINEDNLTDLKSLQISEIPIIVPELNQIQNMAINKRLELKLMNKQKKSVEYNKSALKSSYYPQIYANASYHYAKPGVNFFRNDWMDYYTAGVKLQWELWNWGQNKSKVRKSQLTIEKIDLQAEQLKKDILQQVEEAQKNLQMTKTQINLNKNLVALEKERYRIVKENYEQGLATSTDLNNAEHALTAAELELKKEYISWFQNQLMLDYATGDIGDNANRQHRRADWR